MKALVKHDGQVWEKDHFGSTALDVAVSGGGRSTELVKYLIQQEALSESNSDDQANKDLLQACKSSCPFSQSQVYLVVVRH